jgi:hypothetical protein
MSAKNKLVRGAQSRTAAEPTTEEIRAAAHSLWEQEGRPEGRDIEHWLRAEVLLRQKRGPIKVETMKQPNTLPAMPTTRSIQRLA